MKRAAIFVDGSNFFKYCEELHIYAYQLEWDRLIPDLIMDRQIVYARYYDCPKNEREVPDQAQRQKRFFSLLRGIPWPLCSLRGRPVPPSIQDPARALRTRSPRRVADAQPRACQGRCSRFLPVSLDPVLAEKSALAFPSGSIEATPHSPNGSITAEVRQLAPDLALIAGLAA